MKIEISYNPEKDEHIVNAVFTGSYLLSKCNPLPRGMRDLIAKPDQAIGIIEDAILMAHGYQLNPESPKTEGQNP